MKKRKLTSILLSLSLSFSTAAGMLSVISSPVLAQSETGEATASQYNSWSEFLALADPQTNEIKLNSSGKEIKILAGDCSLSHSLTIDLNGKTLALPDGNPLIVPEETTLTVTDSSADQSGVITSGHEMPKSIAGTLFIHGGIVNLKGGTIRSGGNSNECTVLLNQASSQLNISGGNIENHSVYAAVVATQGKVNLEKGIIWSFTGYGVYMNTLLNITRNSQPSFTMSDGKIVVEQPNSHGAALFLNGAAAEISGGNIFYGKLYSLLPVNDINMLNFELAAAIKIGYWNCGSLTISGKDTTVQAFSSQGLKGVGIWAGDPFADIEDQDQNCFVNILGGTIAGDAAGVMVGDNADITMTGGTIQNSHIGICFENSPNAGKFSLSGAEAHVIAQKNGIGAYLPAGKLTLNQGQIWGGIGVLVEASITGENYSSSAIFQANGGVVESIADSNTVDIISPDIFSNNSKIERPAAIVYNVGSGTLPKTANPLNVLTSGTYLIDPETVSNKPVYPVVMTQQGQVLAPNILEGTVPPIQVGSGSQFNYMVNYYYLRPEDSSPSSRTAGSLADLAQIQQGALGYYEYYQEENNELDSQAYQVMLDNPGYVYTSNTLLKQYFTDQKGTFTNLNLDLNGGILTRNSGLNYIILKDSVINLPEPTKPGFEFAGYLNSAVNEIVANPYTIDSSDTVTLIAQWNESSSGGSTENPGDTNPDNPGETNPDKPENSPDNPEESIPIVPLPPYPETPDNPDTPVPPTEGPGITEPGNQIYPVPDDKYYIIYYTPEDESYSTITVVDSPTSTESLGSIIQIQNVPDDNSFKDPINIFLGVNGDGKPVGIPGNKLPENGPKVSISFHQITRDIAKPVVAIPIIPGTEMPGTVSIDYQTTIPKSVMEENNDLKMPVENGIILTIANNAKTFHDARVYGADYAKTAVAFMSAREMMTGVGNGEYFDLSGTSTRQQFATIIYRYESSPNVSGMTLPEGVLPDAWFTDAAKWAVNQDLMAQGSKFDGSRLISRQDLAVILYRLQGGNPTADLSLLNNYLDKDKVSSYARIPVAWAIEHHILGQGTHGLIDPLDDSERIEMAAMIQRFILNVYEN